MTYTGACGCLLENVNVSLTPGETCRCEGRLPFETPSRRQHLRMRREDFLSPLLWLTGEQLKQIKELTWDFWFSRYVYTTSLAATHQLPLRRRWRICSWHRRPERDHADYKLGKETWGDSSGHEPIIKHKMQQGLMHFTHYRRLCPFTWPERRQTPPCTRTWRWRWGSRAAWSPRGWGAACQKPPWL